MQDVYLQNVVWGYHPLCGGSPGVPDHKGIQCLEEESPPDAAAGPSADAGLAQHVHHTFLGASISQGAIRRVQERRLQKFVYKCELWRETL